MSAFGLKRTSFPAPHMSALWTTAAPVRPPRAGAVGTNATRAPRLPGVQQERRAPLSGRASASGSAAAGLRLTAWGELKSPRYPVYLTEC